MPKKECRQGCGGASHKGLGDRQQEVRQQFERLVIELSSPLPSWRGPRGKKSECPHPSPFIFPIFCPLYLLPPNLKLYSPFCPSSSLQHRHTRPSSIMSTLRTSLDKTTSVIDLYLYNQPSVLCTFPSINPLFLVTLKKIKKYWIKMKLLFFLKLCLRFYLFIYLFLL